MKIINELDVVLNSIINKKFSFKNISLDLISNKENFVIIMNALIDNNIDINFKPVDIIKSGFEIVDVHVEEINDIRTGGYNGEGVYDYSLAKGNILVVEYIDDEVHKMGFLFSYDEKNYGLNTTQLENLARVRFKRLSSNDYYGPLIKATEEVYDEVLTKDLNVIYQFMNTIYKKVKSTSGFEEKYNNADLDQKVMILKSLYLQTEDIIRDNIIENLNDAIEYFNNHKVKTKKNNIYSDIFTELNAGKNRMELVFNLLNLSVFISSHYAVDYNTLKVITLDIINELTNSIDFDNTFNISAYNTENKQKIIDIIKREENFNDSIRMVQKVFSFDQFINRKIARIITNEIKEKDEIKNIDSSIMRPVLALTKTKALADNEKEKYQLFCIENLLNGRIKCEPRILSDMILKSKNKDDLKKAFNSD